MSSTMSNLRDVKTMAAIVSKVTTRMCGTSFKPDDPLSRGESLCGRMIVLPLVGAREINIVLAYDLQGGHALAAALRSYSAHEPTPEIVDECIRELLNMIAAEIRVALGIDHVLGIPRRTTLAEFAAEGQPGLGQGVLLVGEGDVNLRLWILEKPAAGATRVGQEPRKFGVLRSLLRRLVPNS